MPRLVGVDIPNDKPIWIALTYVQGIGRTTSLKMLRTLGIDGTKRAKDMDENEVQQIAAYIEDNLIVEGTLRRMVNQNIDRLKKIRCYRGSRHRGGLPVRGQRTRSNARTRKGAKRTVAGKKATKAKK